MNKESSTEDLVKALQLGTIDYNQVDSLNNTLRIKMAAGLVNSITALESSESELTTLAQSLAIFIKKDIEAKIEMDAMDLEDAVEYFNKIQGAQVRSAETKRKIFNGKEMFATDPLSLQDKALLELMKKINTEEKRKRLEVLLEELTRNEIEPHGLDEFKDE